MTTKAAAKAVAEPQADQYVLRDGELTKEMFASEADVSTKTVENWLKAGTIDGEYQRRTVENRPVRKTLIIQKSELEKINETVKTAAIVKPQEMAEQVNMFLAGNLGKFADAMERFVESSAKQLPAASAAPSRLEQLAGKMYLDIDAAASVSGLSKAKLSEAIRVAENSGDGNHLQRFSGDHGRAVWRTADLEKVIESIPPTPVVKRRPPKKRTSQGSP